jgi:hypothetical protein
MAKMAMSEILPLEQLTSRVMVAVREGDSECGGNAHHDQNAAIPAVLFARLPGTSVLVERWGSTRSIQP